MEEDLISYFKQKMNVPQHDIREYSPLALAYIGDAVYDLLVRTAVVAEGNCPVKKYHKKVSAIVKAEAQSRLIHALMDDLTEEEADIYKRGRNANSYSKAKNASMSAYRHATGFEALLGYLYLTERYARLADLIAIGKERVQDQESDENVVGR